MVCRSRRARGRDDSDSNNNRVDGQFAGLSAQILLD